MTVKGTRLGSYTTRETVDLYINCSLDAFKRSGLLPAGNCGALDLACKTADTIAKSGLLAS